MAAGRGRHIRGVVLARTKLGEQDLIVTLMAGDGSLAKGVAKGARKPGSKSAAPTELFCESDLYLAKSKGLDIISETMVLDAHKRIRGDFERVSAASAVCEMARLSSFEGTPDMFLYLILSRTLTACEEAADQAHLDLTVAAYAFKVLAHGGWKPQLGTCVMCGDESVSRFSVHAGGTLCESCSRELEGAEPVSRNTIEWVRSLIGLRFDELLETDVDPMTARELLALAHVWAATHLEARLKAFEFLLSV